MYFFKTTEVIELQYLMALYIARTLNTLGLYNLKISLMINKV